jgi:hypothetical protein
MERSQIQDKLHPYAEAGMTWWVEGLWNEPEEKVMERIHQGPPQLG